MLFNRAYRVSGTVKRHNCEWPKVIDVMAANKKEAIQKAREIWYGADPWNHPHLFHIDAGRTEMIEHIRWTAVY